ncbi:hypothetical protein J4446_03395 [Candidatus Woesearchaeota archaeon]|nr:hypothetical protein [Candidatus Woesearchaeota archaeon]
MLYIHSLKDLNVKTAEVESVQIIRNVKGRLRIPIQPELLNNNLNQFFIQGKDIESIMNSSELISPTIKSIGELMMKKDSVYELINLNRAVSMIEELDMPLKNNIDYLKEIESWQNQLITDLADVFNNIEAAGTSEEKIELNNKLNLIFRKILRTDDLMFNSEGLINEGKFARIKDLCKSMDEGFFFHFTLREHLDKVDFSIIRRRIPSSEIEKVSEITRNIIEIKKGVDKAYDYNMKMVQMIVNLYSYIKILIK